MSEDKVPRGRTPTTEERGQRIKLDPSIEFEDGLRTLLTVDPADLDDEREDDQ